MRQNDRPPPTALGNGHDSLYPGLDVVNAALGGAAGLTKLVGRRH